MSLHDIHGKWAVSQLLGGKVSLESHNPQHLDAARRISSIRGEMRVAPLPLP
jgi:hypothetical protein